MADKLKPLHTAAKEWMDKYLYAAQEEGVDSYENAIGELEADLEGHNIQLQELRAELEDE